MITEPTSEPVSLTEFKQYARIDFTNSDNDAVCSALLQSSRKYMEGLLGRALATQTILAEYIIDAPQVGPLSGSIDTEPNWYHYLQELGANPFGIAMFYFDLPMPPLQSVTSVSYQYTVFDTDPNNPSSYGYWTPFTGVYVPDYTREPGRIWFQDPPTVYRWQFQYVAGYGAGNAPAVLPYNIRQLIKEVAAFWYDNREGDPLPKGIQQKLIDMQWSV